MVQRNVIMTGEAQWSLLMCFVNLLLVIVATLTCNAAEPKTLKTFVYIADLEQKTYTCLRDARLPGMNFNGSPEWSHDGTRVVFDATPEDGRWLESHIAVYHLEGANKGKTDDLGLGNAPTWSPDGSQIAFFVNPGVAPDMKKGTWVMDADGTGREWLCEGWFPKWSPDGQHLLLSEEFGKGTPMRIYNNVTGKSRRLGRPFLNVDSWPQWSSDGRFAVLRLDKNANRVIETFNQSGKWSSRHRVWPREDVDDGLTGDSVPHHLACSPHGKNLLVCFSNTQKNVTEFYLLPSDGSTASKRIIEGWLPVYPLSIDWGPNGKKIVFVAKLPPDEETPAINVPAEKGVAETPSH